MSYIACCSFAGIPCFLLGWSLCVVTPSGTVVSQSLTLLLSVWMQASSFLFFALLYSPVGQVKHEWSLCVQITESYSSKTWSESSLEPKKEQKMTPNWTSVLKPNNYIVRQYKDNTSVTCSPSLFAVASHQYLTWPFPSSMCGTLLQISCSSRLVLSFSICLYVSLFSLSSRWQVAGLPSLQSHIVLGKLTFVTWTYVQT